MRERSCTHTHTNIACACCKAVPPATRLPMPDQGMQIHPLFWSTRRRSRHTQTTRPQADGYPMCGCYMRRHARCGCATPGCFPVATACQSQRTGPVL